MLDQAKLEEVILKDLGDEFKQGVDKHMSYWLELKYWETQGWTHVMLPRLVDGRHAVDITYWLDANGYVDRMNYYRDGREFVFREPKMASMFILKWV